MGKACNTDRTDERCIHARISEGKRTLVNLRYRMDGRDIKTDLAETAYGNVDLIHVTQNRCSDGFFKLSNDPSGTIKGRESLD
jgi:hypothetical protein